MGVVGRVFRSPENGTRDFLEYAVRSTAGGRLWQGGMGQRRATF